MLVVFVRGTAGVVDGAVASMVVDDGALEEGTVFEESATLQLFDRFVDELFFVHDL